VDRLPPQLKWEPFVAALKKLGYRLYKSHPGSARTFVNDEREPSEVTFHEPHSTNPIRLGTLSEYLRKLKVDRDKFADLLYGSPTNAVEDEERFRRSLESSGHIVSNCTKCYEMVARSAVEAEVLAAEAGHPCFQALCS
jgi:HicA toxin of bacterial toxin-antitoxin,